MGGCHGNMTKPEGVGERSAERDVTPKLYLWYEFSVFAMPTDQSRICRLKKNEYRTTVPILTKIVEDIVEVSDTSSSSSTVSK